MLYTTTMIIDPHAGEYGTAIDAYTDVRIDGPRQTAIVWHMDFERACELFIRLLEVTRASHEACSRMWPTLRTMFGEERAAVVWEFFRQF